MVFNSPVALRLHVCLGRPGFRFPWGFQSSDCLVMFAGSFLKVCPTHRHFRLLTWTAIGSCLALVHRSVLGTLSNHFTLRICRRHLLTKVCILFELLFMTLQVSDP